MSIGTIRFNNMQIYATMQSPALLQVPNTTVFSFYGNLNFLHGYNNSNLWALTDYSSVKGFTETFDFTKFWETTFKKSNNRILKSVPDKTVAGSQSYSEMSRSEALQAAAKNKALEKLIGGNNWTVSTASFINDIPYARKGTSAILAKAALMTGENLVVTSALGTKTSPHIKSVSNSSHYNSTNPKLDLGGGLNRTQAYSLQYKLKGTGLFSRVEVEHDISGNYHLDVQIAENSFRNLDTFA